MEFFSHNGGREGIVDTSVKTADRLFTRKIVKAMESIHIAYDQTVRLGNHGILICLAGIIAMHLI